MEDKPECFSKYPNNPQHRAENCCDDCNHECSCIAFTFRSAEYQAEKAPIHLFNGN